MARRLKGPRSQARQRRQGREGGRGSKRALRRRVLLRLPNPGRGGGEIPAHLIWLRRICRKEAAQFGGEIVERVRSACKTEGPSDAVQDEGETDPREKKTCVRTPKKGHLFLPPSQLPKEVQKVFRIPKGYFPLKEPPSPARSAPSARVEDASPLSAFTREEA